MAPETKKGDDRPGEVTVGGGDSASLAPAPPLDDVAESLRLRPPTNVSCDQCSGGQPASGLEPGAGECSWSRIASASSWCWSSSTLRSYVLRRR